MAYEDVDLEPEKEIPGKSGRGPTKIFLMIMLGVLLVGGSVVTTIMVVDRSGKVNVPAKKGIAVTASKNDVDKKKKDKKEKSGKPFYGLKPYYLELHKPVVVNLDGKSGARYLQVSVALMTYREHKLEVIRAHLPVIRHHLVLLFSSQDFKELQSVAGKRKLQRQTLNMIRAELKKVTGDPLVDAVYLPSIVGQ